MKLEGLTGNQVKAIRTEMEESQKLFCNRLNVTQPVISRLEQRGDEFIESPETFLIRLIAEDEGIDLSRLKV